MDQAVFAVSRADRRGARNGWRRRRRRGRIWRAADAFVWHPVPGRLAPVPEVSAVEIEMLHGIERQKGLVLENTMRFAAGLPANNAMLWGARGMGKSSLVKAAHAAVNARESMGKAGPAGTDRDPSGGYPDVAGAAEPAARGGRGGA